MGMMKFIATPQNLPGLQGGTSLYGHYSSTTVQNKGYKEIRGFTSLANLINEIMTALDANNFSCLEELEINAHGNPNLCDGVSLTNAVAFGAQLKSVRLCDEVSIYLSGCNTAINLRNQFCIAQVISAAGPTEANDNVRLTVYGSVGYLTGTNADNNARTSGDRLYAGLHGAGYPSGYPDAADASGNPGVSIGSHNAVGNACWRGYREGRRIK